MRNYLRVRGEYVSGRNILCLSLELPPRTRRIPPSKMCHSNLLGTTSAYAENTMRVPTAQSLRRNYLRVRGEYNLHHRFCIQHLELPPRTRRIPPRYGSKENYHGNYLRVRGEYGLSNNLYSTPLELPPRTRRIQLINYYFH